MKKRKKFQQVKRYFSFLAGRKIHHIHEKRIVTINRTIVEPSLSMIMLGIIGGFFLLLFALQNTSSLPLPSLKEDTPLREVIIPKTMMYYLIDAFDRSGELEYQGCLKIDGNTLVAVEFPPSTKRVELNLEESFFINSVTTNCNGFDGTIHSHPQGNKNPSEPDEEVFKRLRLACVHYSRMQPPQCYSYNKRIKVYAPDLAFNNESRTAKK